MTTDLIADPWQALRGYTAARIALGRAGASMPTGAVLELSAAHALARDAVHHPLDVAALAAQLSTLALTPLTVQSRARTRAEYLRRPDLGRRLLEDDVARVAAAAGSAAHRLCLVVADGLSALAVERQVVPFLTALLPRLARWPLAPVVLATQARVALGDEIGELMHADFVAVLIGERPGLSSPDSLGIYLTSRPRIGCNDAQRNCISNVRPAGLLPEVAAAKLAYLLDEAPRVGGTGIGLKDLTDARGERIAGPPAALP